MQDVTAGDEEGTFSLQTGCMSWQVVAEWKEDRIMELAIPCE